MDQVQDDLNFQASVDKALREIEKEEEKKSRNALIATTVGALFNPAVAIIGGVTARHLTDEAMGSEHINLYDKKYGYSEAKDIETDLRRVTKELDKQDVQKDLQLAVSTLMLGGLSDKIDKLGFTGAITDPSTYTTWGGERGPLSFSRLFGDWNFGGGAI
jgi:hypothetical protein